MECLYAPVFFVDWLLWGGNYGDRGGGEGESSGMGGATAET